MSAPGYQHLKTNTDQGCLVLRIVTQQVRGDDLAEKLRAELLDAVARAGLNKVVLDFQNVEFISSAGLRPLIALRRKLQESSGQLRLTGLAPYVADVFRTTRLFSGPFELQPDVASAVTNLLTTTPRSGA